jgi:hypothetical protein
MDAAVWRVHMETLRQREPFRDLEVLYRIDGELRVFSVSGEPVFEGDRFTGYRGVSREVTDQRRATVSGSIWNTRCGSRGARKRGEPWREASRTTSTTSSPAYSVTPIWPARAFARSTKRWRR